MTRPARVGQVWQHKKDGHEVTIRQIKMHGYLVDTRKRQRLYLEDRDLVRDFELAPGQTPFHELWKIVDRRTGRRMGVASYTSRENAEAQIQAWRERTHRADITAEMLMNMVAEPERDWRHPEG